MSTDKRLKGLVDRVELIDAEMENLRAERREVMSEVKAVGYDGATFRKVIARRKLSPAERGAADALLEAYEAALEGEGAATVLARSIGADALSLATDLLAAQIEGVGDPARAQVLVEHVLALLDIRAEIAVLREQERGRRKLAGEEGFETAQMALVVRWYEKVAKHGIAAMRGGEEVFRLYRATVDEAGGPVRGANGSNGGAPTGDEKLAALFAKPPKAPTAKQKQVGDALAYARISRMNRGLGG